MSAKVSFYHLSIDAIVLAERAVKAGDHREAARQYDLAAQYQETMVGRLPAGRPKTHRIFSRSAATLRQRARAQRRLNRP